ncbi:hypothetical protein G7Y79_00014g037080 [Physcia stellaris]|nr:hypothetical protein G7Y79_00014g037080 [Physcia stellaris]
MRTALHQAIQLYNGRNWPSSEPVFLIRNREVSLSKILHSYRRKRNYDPVTWHLQNLQGFRPESGVDLRPESGVDLRPESGVDLRPESGVDLIPPAANDSSSASEGSSENGLSMALDTVALAMPQNKTGALMRRLAEPSSHPQGSATLPWDDLPKPIRPPEQYVYSEHMVDFATMYCSYYRSQPRIKGHIEPKVHMETEHGRFGLEIQNGISALLYQSEPSKAHDCFSSAFIRVEAILDDDHPMGLAQLFTAASELAVRAQKHPALQYILKMLVEHTARLSIYRVPKGNPIQQMLVKLTEAERISDELLRVMESMVNSFEQADVPRTDPAHWKLLYLKERYCDCLYHTGTDGTRQVVRANLLSEQEAFYGDRKSSVLWTLTNVADDHLCSNRIDDAERVFRDALHKSEALGGYAKAKIRYAALEGLAKTACWRAHNQLARTKLDSSHSSSVALLISAIDSAISLLEKARERCIEAGFEASQWFGEGNRRSVRIEKKFADICGTLQRLTENRTAGVPVDGEVDPLLFRT